MRLCEYKNIFGEPRKNAHSLRLFDFAVVDIVLTLILAYMIKYLFGGNYFIILLLLVLLGIFLHWLFCVDTKLNTILFSQNSS